LLTPIETIENLCTAFVPKEAAEQLWVLLALACLGFLALVSFGSLTIVNFGLRVTEALAEPLAARVLLSDF